MSRSQEPFREVAAAIIIGSCGRLLYQQRDDKPGLLYAGMVGLFGGHREGNETNLECLQRELFEELGEHVPANRCAHLVSFSAILPHGGGVKGEFFIIRDLQIDQLVVTEGTPLVIEARDLPGLLPRMTPSCCFVSRLFMETSSAVT